jgi:hypothetical protein
VFWGYRIDSADGIDFAACRAPDACSGTARVSVQPGSFLSDRLRASQRPLRTSSKRSSTFSRDLTRLIERPVRLPVATPRLQHSSQPAVRPGALSKHPPNPTRLPQRPPHIWPSTHRRRAVRSPTRRTDRVAALRNQSRQHQRPLTPDRIPICRTDNGPNPSTDGNNHAKPPRNRVAFAEHAITLCFTLKPSQVNPPHYLGRCDCAKQAWERGMCLRPKKKPGTEISSAPGFQLTIERSIGISVTRNCSYHDRSETRVLRPLQVQSIDGGSDNNQGDAYESPQGVHMSNPRTSRRAPAP